MTIREIAGHPVVEAPNLDDQPQRISVCAECEQVRTILFLSRDRWYCTSCRSHGDARPTQIPLRRPGRST